MNELEPYTALSVQIQYLLLQSFGLVGQRQKNNYIHICEIWCKIMFNPFTLDIAESKLDK